jgi:uncharacterized protein (DUF2141 family)
MKIKHLTILSGIIFLFTLTSQKVGSGNVHVEIKDLKNDKGSIKLTLFNSLDGFPQDAQKAFRTASVTIKDRKAIVDFENLPYGDYAIALLHDENNNNKMDFHFYGMPKEGYGASNDAKGMFGPPKFDDAKFKLEGPDKTIVIHVKN